MSRFVPYLSKEAIERDAETLLAEYARARGVVIEAPVSIEDIVEKHFKLVIEFDDTHRLFGVPRSGLDFEPDILGAIFVDDGRIVIDESLDPDENPAIEGRYRFTLAHEGGGHWRLHRHLFACDPSQDSWFHESSEPTVICRSSQAKKRVEWQADYYASCLLMPKSLVASAWRERFGNANPRILRRKNCITLPGDAGDELSAAIRSFERQRDDEVLHEFVRPFADKFKVSMIAMRIRLEQLGLLQREVPRQLSLAGRA